MQKLDSKKSKHLTVLCTAAYFVSYITRINFAAVLTAIISDGLITKPEAGAVTTLGFITYGVGQLISGKLGDKISPKVLMFAGFVTTALMNFTIPFCKSGTAMCCVWAVNGFAQSFMWPPLVKIMKTAFDTENYNKCSVAVSWGSTSATIVIYLLSPLVISLVGWKYVFFIAGSIAVLMSAFWMFRIGGIEKQTGLCYHVAEKKERKSKLNSSKLATSQLILILLGIFLQGCLRDGVTTWVPTYVSEVFNLGDEVSILSGVLLPIFTLASIQLSSVIYRKMGQKPFKSAALLFVVSTACAVLLALMPDVSVIITILLMAILVACMHGINLILICFAPAKYADEENVAFISGIFNFMTYVGSATSTYGFALLSEDFGWSGTILSWIAIAFFGMLVCVIGNKRAKETE